MGQQRFEHLVEALLCDSGRGGYEKAFVTLHVETDHHCTGDEITDHQCRCRDGNDTERHPGSPSSHGLTIFSPPIVTSRPATERRTTSPTGTD